MSDLIELDAKYVVGTYKRDTLFVRGEGCRLWDDQGKAYLDFTAGISVCNVGHCHPKVTAAIAEQAGRLVHVSNLYYNEQQPRLAARIVTRSFGGKVFFANSGAEANEGLIKFARKWGAAAGKSDIVCMSHSFHGRTLATLGATDKPKLREGFAPDMPGFQFAEFNDLASVAAAITPSTAAVLLEPVQGEGGIHPGTPEFIQGVRALCDEHGILMLLDEVQSGMGRTGRDFAYQHYDIVPDAMSLAKALGNGFPIGALVVHDKWKDVLGPSSHASTFGGTALACAAALAVFDVLEEEDLVAQTVKVGDYFMAELRRITAGCNGVTVRGLGLMIGVEFDQPAGDIVAKAKAAGLLVLTAGENVLRVLPPLTITQSEVDEAIAILEPVISEVMS